jgi:glycosyltransferase involved in cell wall biosynthesis
MERSFARNTGMKAAKGNFLTLLDSDDLMHKDNLYDAAVFIRAKPEFKFFHNLFHLVNEKDEVIYTPRVRDNKTAVKSISYGNFLGCIGIFLAREVYQQYHFDENPVVIGSEDWDLWIRVIARYPVGRIHKINNSVVEHSERSIASFTPDSILKRRIYILEKVKNDPALRLVYDKYLNVMQASGYVLAASTANAARAFKAGKKYIRKALYINPLLIFDLPFLRIIYLNATGSVFSRKKKPI